MDHLIKIHVKLLRSDGVFCRSSYPDETRDKVIFLQAKWFSCVLLLVTEEDSHITTITPVSNSIDLCYFL